MVERGEIWWYEPPNRKRRPVLVLSRGEVIPLLAEVVVVPATGTIRGLPSEVRMDEGDGMPRECVLAFDTLLSAERAFLIDKVASLAPHRWYEVCDALKYAMGC